MKELSIEEKAKRYDEAIKKAESLYKVAEPMSGCNVIIETIFPELKESEDERIRKEILEYLQQFENEELRGVNISDWIAWLEKQAEYANFRNKIQIGDKVTRNRDGVLVNLSQLNRVAKKDEKQGEQQSADVDNKFIRMRETKPKDISEFLDRLTTVEQEFLWEHIAKIRELDKEEQKPTDKVEPKFKVGDWITFYGGKPFKILKVESEQNGILDYLLLSQNGHNSYYNKKYVDENARLWTIQDAKEGDVLFIGIDASTCIFKKLEGNLLYSYIISDGKLLVEDSHYYYEISDNVYPATKEQRDTLFAKMKEAGYEWNSDKKELKKIEQKPNYCHHEVDLSGCSEEYCKAYYDGWNNCNQQHAQLEAEQKPAWSEEDEAKLKYILFHIEDVENKDVIDWLKSLKDRVQPQPKQELSEEDKTNIDSLLDVLYRIKKGKDPQATTRLIEQHINFIESLKGRYTWKPSDEQMKVLEFFIPYVTQCNVVLQKSKDTLLSLLSDLKKLKG